MSKIDKSLSSQSWQASVRILEDFLKSDQKLDSILERYSKGMESLTVRRMQYLSYGVVRDLGYLLGLLRSTVRKLPKKRLQAIMLVSLFEWLEADEEKRPQVVHHSVERSKELLSKPEARFANAVLRRMPELQTEIPVGIESIEDMAFYYSHPEWLVAKWIEQWGVSQTKCLLEWNQKTPLVYLYSLEPQSEIPSDWAITGWQSFYNVQQADWDTIRTWLASGRAYIQDPATRLGAALLDLETVGSVLDLCAAPGGKSIQLLQRITAPGGLLVSVDVPGVRFQRLQENLDRYQKSGIEKFQVAADVLDLEAANLPQATFDVVYLDVPCSNTGVLQRRPDAKWRQSESMGSELTALQGALLKSASRFVARGGALIYSTCSVNVEENQGVVEQFVEEANEGFLLEKQAVSLPWQSGHDGAGVFLLRSLR